MGRLISYLLAVLLLAGVSMAPLPAQAQNLGCNQNSSCDQGEAITECQKYDPVPTNFNIVSVTRRNCLLSGPRADGSGSYYLQYWGKNANGNEIGAYGVGDFHFKSTCAARQGKYPPGDAAPWYSAPSTCVSGCQIGGTPFTQESGGVKVYGMKDRYYTGETCQTPGTSSGISPEPGKESETKPKPDECTALGSGQTACVKPNGDHCTTSSTGKSFCWKPNETGEKKDGSDAQTKGEKGKPVMPPSSTDPTKEYQRKEGHQQTACINNTCTTYNVTNYEQTGKGQAKNSTGDNSADGSGNSSGNGAPGKGNGSGGGKDGEGDSASDSGNCQQPPVCVGDTLKCLHLKFTWKIECNTKGNTVTGGDGCSDGDVPVCAGDSCKAEQYAQVLQQWKQRCAVQAMGEGMANRAGAISNPDDAGVVDGIWIKEGNVSGPKLRQDLVNVAGGGSLLPQVSIEGHQWEVPQGFYDAIAAVRTVIIAMCTVLAMFIVGRNI